ncbi:hypothetical protein A1019T_01938 [Psychrobacter pasteurii]|uniref:DUF4440 domain-containing protein n=1 Tax=Psychrobacter pasteurii TaxID=1945520 RepID=A0A1R4EHN0_9GAMM|nr:hypothetical protein [Psychrobacter pasteurii]SJM37953.1 hypothetical protein A1019T_01938 [Psychrobacter pasteurii]
MNSLFGSRKSLVGALTPVAMVAAVSFAATSAQAAINEAAVQNYATQMKQAANSKNVSKVSNLVADEALISLSRRGRTTSLDKAAYLKLLQDSWSKSSNYSYDISISNVVITGEQAKADVKTVETWVKDGQQRTMSTTSRATLKSDNNNAVLLRAVSQVTIE